MEPREIKFRAWKVNWKDNDPTSPQGDMLVNIPIEAVTLSQNLDFQSSSLQFMQYTGLKDKNGKEIYEGDVVEWDSLNADHVTTTRRRMTVTYTVDETMSQFNLPFTVNPHTIEVLGNIYENPELLQV